MNRSRTAQSREGAAAPRHIPVRGGKVPRDVVGESSRTIHVLRTGRHHVIQCFFDEALLGAELTVEAAVGHPCSFSHNAAYKHRVQNASAKSSRLFL